jgi:prolyl-tRNA synthetase
VGVSRAMAAVVEQYNDEYGIKWPAAIAPAHVCILPLAIGDNQIQPEAERIAKELAALGVEVVIDDRDERPGVKFAEADLMGWPVQIIIGKRGLANREYEVKNRMTGKKRSISFAEYAEALAFAKRAKRPVHAFLQQTADVIVPRAVAPRS